MNVHVRVYNYVYDLLFQLAKRIIMFESSLPEDSPHRTGKTLIKIIMVLSTLSKAKLGKSNLLRQYKCLHHFLFPARRRIVTVLIHSLKSLPKLKECLLGRLCSSILVHPTFFYSPIQLFCYWDSMKILFLDFVETEHQLRMKATLFECLARIISTVGDTVGKVACQLVFCRDALFIIISCRMEQLALNWVTERK